MLKSLYENIFLRPRYIAQMQSFLAVGQYAAAMERVEKLLELNHENGEYIRLRGEVKFHQQDYDGALADVEQSMRLDRNAENLCHAHILRGRIHQAQDDLTTALKDYSNAINTSSVYSMPAFIERGKLFMSKEQYERATEDFSMALRFEITTSIMQKANIRVLRGEAQIKLKRHQEAIEDFQKAIFYDPRHFRANSMLAEAYIVTKQFQEAISVLNNAMRVDSKHSDKYDILRRKAYEGLGMTPPDLPQTRQALGQPAEEPVKISLEEQAFLKARQGDLQGALADIDEALSVNRRNGKALILRGNICYALNKHDGALASFRQAQTTSNLDYVNAGMAGEALTLYKLGDIDDARKTWQKLVHNDSLFSNPAKAKKQLGWTDENMHVVRELLGQSD